MARFGLFWGVLIKLLAKKGRNTWGYGVKIMKLNENIDQSVKPSRGQRLNEVENLSYNLNLIRVVRGKGNK
jgi:hypothetical protein